MKRGLYLCCFLLLTSCETGRRAQPIDTPVAALATATVDCSDALFSRDETLPEGWWILFDDEQLSDFIQIAFFQNPTLQSAKAKILVAAYTADQARSPLFPNLTWGGDISRQKFSQTGIIPFKTPETSTNPAPIAATGGQSGIPVYFTQYESELTLTFDFDIWDKNRNTWKAALGEQRSRLADEAFIRLQLGISIAQVYYQLQTSYKRLEIAQALVKNQDQFESLTQQRLHSNLETKQALSSVKTNVATATQAMLQIKGDIAVYENQLRAYLAGNLDETIRPIDIKPLPKVPLPCELPLHLLSNRPDITAQLWLIQSAGRLIEVAKAAFYPDFNLFSLIGYQTIHLHKLFKYPSVMFNVDPAFSLPIFDGWRLLANLRGSEINYDLAILQYNQMVITAVREVLDGLVVLSNSDEQLQEFQKALEEQEVIYNNSQLRVAYNLNSGLDDLVNEQNLLIARDRKIQAYGKKIQAILQLIKALGGGYNSEV